MTGDLLNQLERYGNVIDEAVPIFDFERVETGDMVVAGYLQPEPSVRAWQQSSWVVAAASFGIVLLVGGAIALIMAQQSGSAPVTENSVPVVTVTVIPTPPPTTDAPPPTTAAPTETTTTVATVTELPVPEPDLSAEAWTSIPATTEVFADASVEDVTAFGTGMVAVGVAWTDGRFDAAVWTSPDGLAWFRVPHDEETFGGGWMRAIQSDGDQLVAVGLKCDEVDDDCTPGTATVWTSVDGSSWQRVTHDPTVFGFDGQMTDLVAYENGWLSVGSTCDAERLSCPAAAWSSPDGISWTRTLFADSAYSPTSVTRGGGLFVAVGYGPVTAIWTSSDGVEWLLAEHDPALFGTGQPTATEEFYDAHVESVTYSCFGQASCGFTAVGSMVSNDDERARIWTSTNGSTWTVAFEGPAHSVALDVAADGDTIVAVGTAIWRTLDGVTWVQVADPEPWSWAVAAGTTKWVSVPGVSHPIWVSPPPN
jgi:hypothetical protein